tara:strand:- start:2886 stop:3053 length:168 start_codon:yes stop_codon:yes gene_type:complete
MKQQFLVVMAMVALKDRLTLMVFCLTARLWRDPEALPKLFPGLDNADHSTNEHCR